MLGKLLNVFGDSNDKEIKRYDRVVEAVGGLENGVAALDDAALRDEDRRGQDARRHPARLPQRPRRQGRPRRDRQRLPGAARRHVDGQGLLVPRPLHRLPPARVLLPPGPRLQARRRDPRTCAPSPQGGLRGRHHLRHEQRVRLRLPARQHGRLPRAEGAARVALRHRRRGGQHPHRRGPDAAHHQRPVPGADDALRHGRPRRPTPARGRGLHHRREGAPGPAHRRRASRRSRRSSTSATSTTRPTTSSPTSSRTRSGRSSSTSATGTTW